MYQVFLSYDSAESEVAEGLKRIIENSFLGGIKVFVSGSFDDVPLGSRWLDNIAQCLRASNVLLVLCSSSSVTRPWVNFEAGGGWVRDIPIVPICYLGVDCRTLPQPLSFFQAIDFDNPRFLRSLLHALCRQLQIQEMQPLTKAVLLDYIQMRRRFAKTDRQLLSLRHEVESILENHPEELRSIRDDLDKAVGGTMWGF